MTMVETTVRAMVHHHQVVVMMTSTMVMTAVMRGVMMYLVGNRCPAEVLDPSSTERPGGEPQTDRAEFPTAFSTNPL